MKAGEEKGGKIQRRSRRDRSADGAGKNHGFTRIGTFLRTTDFVRFWSS